VLFICPNRPADHTVAFLLCWSREQHLKGKHKSLWRLAYRVLQLCRFHPRTARNDRRFYEPDRPLSVWLVTKQAGFSNSVNEMVRRLISTLK
jgi:hypothetical protein